MKTEHTLIINAPKKYQPQMEEVREVVSMLVWKKVEADKNRVEAGDYEVQISDVPGGVEEETVIAARRRANVCQNRLGKLIITTAKNLKDKGYSNAAIADAMGIEESQVRSSIERAAKRKS